MFSVIKEKLMNTNIKVLVVDDFATMRRIVTNLLNNIGFTRIEEAEDGIEGFDKAKSGEFDLIISDWNMPRLDGLEMVKQIRSLESGKRIPILMVTAESKREQIIAAAQAGVNGYIVKPFNEKTLREKLEKILA